MTTLAQPAPAGAARRRWFAAAALALLAVLLLVDLGTFMRSAADAIGYPFELDYGEGIVWQQMADIVAGRGYAPLGTYPAIVYHYPPVYHLVVAFVAWVGGLDPLAAGRLVSAASTLGCVAIIARWTWLAIPSDQPRAAKLIGGGLAGLSFAVGPTVLNWSALMRVDMLACLLTLSGLWLAVEAIRQPARQTWLLSAAALAFALAVYTKQTSLAGPVIAFVTLWIARPRAAWSFLILCGGLGVAALAAMMVATGGTFLDHVLLYNVNRLDPSRWYLLVVVFAPQIVSCALALTGAIAAWRWLRPLDWRGLRIRMAEDPATAALVMALLYFAFRTLTLPMVLKSGANDNYLIDWFSVAAVFVGLGIAAVATAIERGRDWPPALTVGLVLAGLSVQAWRVEMPHPITGDAETRDSLERLADDIRATTRPVISDDMVLLLRAGKPVEFEPAIVAELAHTRYYDQAALVAMIRRGDFAYFVTRGLRGDKWFDEHYNPPVVDAMDAAYPRLEQRGGLILHRPR